MGVFDAVPEDGKSITAAELAEKLGVDKELLGESSCRATTTTNQYIVVSLTKAFHEVRFMRNGTSIGPFAEVGFEEYAHTPHSLAYNVPALRAIFSFL
jgi:hypothetical protein